MFIFIETYNLKLILSFLQNKNIYNEKQLKSEKKISNTISKINIKFNELIQPKLQIIKQINYLTNKYYVRNQEIDDNFCGTLYDVLSTGLYNLPMATSYTSLDKYTPDIIDDVKLILKTMPYTINYYKGWLRCRHNISSLYMACINEKIPLEIVKEIYLQTKDLYINVNGIKKNLRYDIVYIISQHRYDKIKEFIQ